MFTGIIREIGEIEKITKSNDKTTFTVKTQKILKGKKTGDSIAVNGVCTTITQIKNKSFTFDAMPETLRLTNLGITKINDEVNLENTLKYNQEINGHLVQGHVDCVGVVEKFQISTNNQNKNIENIIKIKFPKKIAKFLALKGSITINGVSLTISDLKKETLSINLIPHTINNTNLYKLKKNDKVNLEIDIVARYLERLIEKK